MRSISLFALLIISVSALAQKNVNKPRAEALKKFKDAKVVAFRCQTTYDFSIVGDAINVAETNNMGMIALEGNTNYQQRIFYSDNQTLESAELQYVSGKSIPLNKVCGNYEVENIFYSDAKLCVYPFNFLYEGTEIEFRSKTVYHDPKYLTNVFFQEDIPVEERELIFTVPANITIELVEKNFDGYKIQKNITTEGNKKIYKYSVKELKAYKDEANAQGMLYRYPHVIVLTKDFTGSSGKKNVLASVDDLYRWYASLVKDVKNDKTIFDEQVKKLTAKAATPEEKIKAIYYWVQDNVKYIAFEDGLAGYRPEAAQNVYHNRYGDCKGMANLTKEMLKAAGFDARLTWIGTDRIPYGYELPSLVVNNHMICTVFINDKKYILDPTEKYIALGLNGERIQGKEMLIENGAKYILEKVPVATADQNLITQQENITIENDALTGHGEITINGEAQKSIFYYSANIKQEDKKKILDHLVLSDYTNTDKLEVTANDNFDRDKALEVKYNYTLNNRMSKFDNDLYVDLDWNKTYKNLKMEEDRESDYYFNRKVNLKVVKKLHVPDGYTVTHLPKTLNKVYPDFSFVVSYEQKGADLIYSSEIKITHGLIRKADFNTWNSTIKELGEMYNDQIVFTKAK